MVLTHVMVLTVSPCYGVSLCYDVSLCYGVCCDMLLAHVMVLACVMVLSLLWCYQRYGVCPSFGAYLIFVTGTTGRACGEFFCHVEKFLHMTDFHVEKFST